MAQTYFITPKGGLKLNTTVTYTSADVPTGQSIDTVTLTRGVRIVDDESNPTPLRGVRMRVSVAGATYPQPNVPFIWLEGQTITFLSGINYNFSDEGIVMFGTKVAV
jgi:hypothetical protein